MFVLSNECNHTPTISSTETLFHVFVFTIGELMIFQWHRVFHKLYFKDLTQGNYAPHNEQIIHTSSRLKKKKKTQVCNEETLYSIKQGVGASCVWSHR